MGMFDEVRIELLYCPFCGAEIKNAQWQTKDGDCTLELFPSLEDFGNRYYKQSYFSIVETCCKCGKFIDLSVPNESKEHDKYFDELRQQHEQRMIEECTKCHPNHTVYAWRAGKPDFWTCWCNICKEKGYPRDLPNPDMDPKYLEICIEQAKNKYLNVLDDTTREVFEKRVSEIGWEAAVEEHRQEAIKALSNMFDKED